MNKVLKIEQYIQEFFSTRFSDYKAFYKSERENRQVGIYKLENGTSLLNFFDNIMGHIEEKLYSEKLGPQQFASPELLLDYLKSFKSYLEENQTLLDDSKAKNRQSYIVDELQKMKNELVVLLDQLVVIYDTDDVTIPYQELRHALITKDLDGFFEDLNSILASVSYAISKVQEGFLHSNIHVILKLLGFHINAEESTNTGRIDAVLRLANIIYIFEFKLGTSQQAMEQIKEKKYYEKFIIERKEILLVGVAFDTETRGVSDYQMEPWNASRA